MQRILFLPFLLLLLGIVSCAVPSSRTVQVSVVGQLLSENGMPLEGKKLELTLPAEYGLLALDTDYLESQSYQSETQTVVVTTDALGSFTHSFSPREFSTARWILPPVGSVPRKAPQPFIHLRMPGARNRVTTILFHEDSATFGIRDSLSGQTIALSEAELPANIEGNVERSMRGDTETLLAKLRLRLRTPAPYSIRPKW